MTYMNNIPHERFLCPVLTSETHNLIVLCKKLGKGLPYKFKQTLCSRKKRSYKQSIVIVVLRPFFIEFVTQSSQLCSNSILVKENNKNIVLWYSLSKPEKNMFNQINQIIGMEANGSRTNGWCVKDRN